MYRKAHSAHESPAVITTDTAKRIKNPHQLTIDQHVLPQAHLQEWLWNDGRLQVSDSENPDQKLSPALADAFVVKRLWDQAAESGLLKSTEDNYQRQNALMKQSLSFSAQDRLSAYFVMLCVRASIASRPRPDGESTMTLSSPPPEQERLEEMEMANARDSVQIVYPGGPGGDGSQSIARAVVSMAMGMEFRHGMRRFGSRRWLAHSLEQDVVLPDSLVRLAEQGLAILPATPTVVLLDAATHDRLQAAGHLDADAINDYLRRAAQRYCVLAPPAVPHPSGPRTPQGHRKKPKIPSRPAPRTSRRDDSDLCKAARADRATTFRARL